MTNTQLELLDEAYQVLDSAWIENSTGFVNHTPMACEALAALGLVDKVVPWAERGSIPAAPAPRVTRRITDANWHDALGETERLGDWNRFFAEIIEEFGWMQVVRSWAPRLMPSMGSMLFHALIKTAHAIRATSQLDSAPRRAELTRALAFWASRFGYGRRVIPPVIPVPRFEHPRSEPLIRQDIARLASDAARWFVAMPDALTLHAVTGAMAVHLVAEFVPATAAEASVVQLTGTYAQILGAPKTVELPASSEGSCDWASLARRAAATHDEHAVKLTEAAFRGAIATNDPVFEVAAQIASSR